MENDFIRNGFLQFNEETHADNINFSIKSNRTLYIFIIFVVIFRYFSMGRHFFFGHFIPAETFSNLKIKLLLVHLFEVRREYIYLMKKIDFITCAHLFDREIY